MHLSKYFLPSLKMSLLFNSFDNIELLNGEKKGFITKEDKLNFLSNNIIYISKLIIFFKNKNNCQLLYFF